MEAIVLGAAAGLLVLVGVLNIWGMLQLRGLRPLPEPPFDADPPPTANVSVIVPARNEEANIQRCVTSYQTQSYPSESLEFIVVDDESEDRTASLVQALEVKDPRVRLVKAGPLPAGWLGKPHACWQGYRHARGGWLCFVDADTWASPDLLRHAVDFAESKRLDCLSLMPAHEAAGFWVPLALPATAMLILLSAPAGPRTINDDAQKEGGAVGPFILVRRSAYETTGGHQAIARKVVDDHELGRLLKGHGYRLRLLDGSHLLGVRMYTNLNDLWQGFSKNLATIAGKPSKALAIAFGVLLIPWTSLALTGMSAWLLASQPTAISAAAFALSASALAALLVTQAVIAGKMGGWRWVPYAVLYPVAYTLAAAVMLNSVRWLLGNRVLWKGRRLDVSE